MKKRYIVTKFVLADSAMHALRLEKKFSADSVWPDEKWIGEQVEVKRELGIQADK